MRTHVGRPLVAARLRRALPAAPPATLCSPSRSVRRPGRPRTPCSSRGRVERGRAEGRTKWGRGGRRGGEGQRRVGSGVSGRTSCRPVLCEAAPVQSGRDEGDKGEPIPSRRRRRGDHSRLASKPSSAFSCTAGSLVSCHTVKENPLEARKHGKNVLVPSPRSLAPRPRASTTLHSPLRLAACPT